VLTRLLHVALVSQPFSAGSAHSSFWSAFCWETTEGRAFAADNEGGLGCNGAYLAGIRSPSLNPAIALFAAAVDAAAQRQGFNPAEPAQ
jgi:hypothetical protein